MCVSVCGCIREAEHAEKLKPIFTAGLRFTSFSSPGHQRGKSKSPRRRYGRVRRDENQGKKREREKKRAKVSSAFNKFALRLIPDKSKVMINRAPGMKREDADERSTYDEEEEKSWGGDDLYIFLKIYQQLGAVWSNNIMMIIKKDKGSNDGDVISQGGVAVAVVAVVVPKRPSTHSPSSTPSLSHSFALPSSILNI